MRRHVLQVLSAPVRRGPVLPQCRALMLRPDGTVNADRFPRGYAPLYGSESLETIYEMLRDGHFVCPETHLSEAHSALRGVTLLLRQEYPVNTMDDLIFLQNKKKELLSRVLVRRDFWSYEDFNDQRENTSFGIQNMYFDNYQWSQHLWPQFQSFVEKWYPQADHTHLTYREYLSLITYFAAQVKGVTMHPLLASSHKLKPPLGVAFPSRAGREPLVLFAMWLSYFRAPLMLNKALVVHGGCGVLGMMMRARGVPMVRVADPSPLAIEGARDDAKRLGYLYRNMSFMTAEMFPPLPTPAEATATRDSLQHTANLDSVVARMKKHLGYNLVVFHADLPVLRGLVDGDPDYHFSPGLQGYSKHLERFFEECSRYLSHTGVCAIITTNLYSLAYPDRPNPIEYEIKHNRRWLLLDYFDRPMRGTQAGAAIDQWSHADATSLDDSFNNLARFKGKLRSELWILHKVDALPEFAWLHGVPGAAPPSHVAKFWKRRKLRSHRERMMRQQVERMGGDWGSYKSRMLQVLQENAGDGDDPSDMESAGGEPEDDEAVQIRMALDPTYPEVLAKRAARAVERKQAAKRQFVASVEAAFAERSPREEFDAWAAQCRDLQAVPVVGDGHSPHVGAESPAVQQRRERVPSPQAPERSS